MSHTVFDRYDIISESGLGKAINRLASYIETLRTESNIIQMKQSEK